MCIEIKRQVSINSVLPLQKMGRKVTLAKVAQHVNEHGMKPVKGKLKGSDFHSSGILHTGHWPTRTTKQSNWPFSTPHCAVSIWIGYQHKRNPSPSLSFIQITLDLICFGFSCLCFMIIIYVNHFGQNSNINHDFKLTQRRFSMVEFEDAGIENFSFLPPMQFAAQDQLWFCKNHHRYRETKNVSRYLLI